MRPADDCKPMHTAPTRRGLLSSAFPALLLPAVRSGTQELAQEPVQEDFGSRISRELTEAYVALYTDRERA
jgi:hypothetical protein